MLSAPEHIPAFRRTRSRAIFTALACVLAVSACSGAGAGNGNDDTGADGGINRTNVERSFGELDAIVEQVMDETGVPGVAVAVVYEDEVVYEAGYGVREVGTDDEVSPETVFQIASLSKPVSSTIMAGLVGTGAFAWDDPISLYAPQFELSDPWVSEHVTFEDLFAHRSGIPGGSGGNDLEAVGYDRAVILERMRFLPLDPFRATYSYSNFGMTMAGEAAAIAAGTTWEDAAETVLFDPAGMTSTSMRHADFLAAQNRATLHANLDGEWVAAFERIPDAQAPAGGVSSNVVDLAQWLRLQLAGGTLDGVEVIDRAALDSTQTPHVMSSPPATPLDPAGYYGAGWVIPTDAVTGDVRWSHSGAFSTGASTTAVLQPTHDLGIVVLTNAAPIGAPEAIADAYLDFLHHGEASTHDWIELWTTRFAGVYGDVPEYTPPADPTPAQADDVYVGTYANEYVGEVAVVVGADGGLEFVVGPNAMAFTLDHFDGDTFLYVDAPELPEFVSTATFTVVDGVATSLTLESFDGAGLGTLARV